MTSIIRVLSEQTINQIAAGEVIEHPASVVKELVENSLDAKAKIICVEIIAGGFALIKVTDDGCGMSSDDALLSLERHATSKIRKVDDLFSLSTMGFRGEALASIGAISKLTLITSQNQQGVKVVCEGGRHLHVEPCARRRGTSIEVRSLFYTTPARKKFQKSPSQSLGEIHKLLQTLALSRPDVSFKLNAQEITLLDVPAQTLEERIKTILGDQVAKSLIKIEDKHENLHLEGMISHIHFHKPNRTGQFLFVNERAVEAKEVSYGVLDGYGMMLDKGRYPYFVLHMQLSGAAFDVNVHPQKKEIRFKEQDVIKTWIAEAIRKSLRKPCEFKPITFSSSFSSAPIETLAFTKEKRFESEELKSFDVKEFSVKIQNDQLLFCQELIAPGIEDCSFIGLFRQYAIVDKAHAKPFMSAPYLTQKEGLLMIDLKAASFKVRYEAWKEAHKIEKHGLLFPIKIELSSSKAQKMERALEFFDKVGFLVRKLGSTLFIVEEAIANFPEEQIAECLMGFIEDEWQGKLDLETKIEKALLQILSRINSKDYYSNLDQAKKLLTQLLRTENPFYSPQGKKILAEIQKDMYEKLF